MTRQEAIQILRTRIVPTMNWQEIHEAIDMAIEALQTDVVRCKDCKHLKTMCEDEGTCYYWCKHWNNATDDWGHCYYGERREL